MYTHRPISSLSVPHAGKKKLLELDAENRHLNKVINVDNAQAIARLEQQAADYKEQATTLETMLKHSNRQLEQVRCMHDYGWHIN